MRDLTVGARGVCAIAVLCILCACTGTGYPAPSTRGGGSSAPRFSLTQIGNTFSAMSVLEPLSATGKDKGPIVALLPETATAGYFANTVAPELAQSFRRAGLAPSEYKVQLSRGSDQFSQAKAAIKSGASVLILDARYSGEGITIESYAHAHRVPVIDYDWLTLNGDRQYYVGFDSLKIGVLLGDGLVSCASKWGVRQPRVIVMTGGSTDYNAPIYAQGYDAILARHSADGWTVVSRPPGTWTPLVALSEFQQQYTSRNRISAALIPNDENGGPIITYLRDKGVKPRTFPTTGMDASVGGLQNILAGYQCGTIYKPVYLETQAAAALAMYLRAGVKPPPTLLNWNITDPQTGIPVSAALLTPEWVTPQNITSTVIADKFVTASSVCTAAFARACEAAGIRG